MKRRDLLLRAMALGVAPTLEGCNYDDPQHPDIADKFLRAMSAWNDRVQAALFNPRTLAPTFRPDQITRPPRFNAFYDIAQAPIVDPASCRLELGGQIAD
ncbi:MAG: molybdopterin-binding protein, partial [Acidocella sp.]|nr:molybdopterin-binding protein [Acidocella sp.]